MAAAKDWDVERYEAGHSYVWTFGRGVIEWLKPQAGERILDAGCGAGPLSAEIASSGATVLGVDSAPAMIAQARLNYPKARYPNLEFALADLTSFSATDSFDAVFSNAALHWVRPPELAAQRLAAALRPGGRFVAEFGGKGNVARVQAALGEHRYPWFFPSIAEYCAILEGVGLEPVQAILFDRPTQVESLEDWLQMYLPGLTALVRASVVEQLKPDLFANGVWTLDYRRLRIQARKRI
ncbi:MAG TPA: class I SAM-dependent methyltransferase [Bryobacteraceae bacterium]